MQRRACLTSLMALMAGANASLQARAQGGPPQAGRQYQRLPRPMPTNTPGKVELIEFFWYGCPHCFLFDPALKQWLGTMPADVSFRRVHVGFGGVLKLHQRFFYTLEALGVEAELHDRVFNAFHVERLDTGSDEALQALAVRLGLDPAKYRQAWASFGVQTKCLQATRLSDDYGIDGVPTLAVAGRFLTAPDMVRRPGLNEQQLGPLTMAVVDHLVSLARQG